MDIRPAVVAVCGAPVSCVVPSSITALPNVNPSNTAMCNLHSFTPSPPTPACSSHQRLHAPHPVTLTSDLPLCIAIGGSCDPWSCSCTLQSHCPPSAQVTGPRGRAAALRRGHTSTWPTTRGCTAGCPATIAHLWGASPHAVCQPRPCGPKLKLPCAPR